MQVFVAELLVNMTARGFGGFFRSGWNVFDVVVIIGALSFSLTPSSLPGEVPAPCLPRSQVTHPSLLHLSFFLSRRD